MAKFHINEKGEARPCSAELQCRFGAATEHYATAEAAQRAYEAQNQALPTPPKKNSTAADLTGFKLEDHLVRQARIATAHNSGLTVLESQRLTEDSVRLRMSSWPRAMEVKSALDPADFVVTFEESYHGQWIRVAKLTEEETVNSEDLEWDSEHQTFHAKVSALGCVPRFIRGRSGEVVEVERLATTTSKTQIESWTLIPRDKIAHKWALIVRNS